MTFFSQKTLNLSWLLLACSLLMSTSHASVYNGETYTHKLPDGKILELVITGSDLYAITQTKTGYTLVFDSQQQQYFYATKSTNGTELISSGIIFDGQIEPDDFAIEKNIQLDRKSKLKTIDNNRAKKLAQQLDDLPADIKSRSMIKSFDEDKDEDEDNTSLQFMSADNMIGTVNGLTILIDFSDEVGTISKEQVDNYLHQVGYKENENNGSVRDYFLRVSNGLLKYNNKILGYYRASKPKLYYTSGVGYARARELVREVIEHYRDEGYDFTQLTATDFYGQDTVMAINLFYAGHANSAWSNGLWPHASGVSVDLGDDFKTNRYQMTAMKDNLTLGTFCHETGHLVLGYPDFYDTDFSSYGLGEFGLMTYHHKTNPPAPNAALRSRSNWETVVELNPSVNASAPSGAINETAYDGTVYKYSNPDKDEAFYIESGFRNSVGKNIPDEGLMIWHVDNTVSSNRCNDMTENCHYQISLIQADGKNHLETQGNYGGSGDLFHKGYLTQFNDTTITNANWWDGGSSNLNIVDIGDVGETICFALETGQCPSDNIAPTAVISAPSTADVSQAVMFDAAGSFDADGEIVQYQWDYGDGYVTTSTTNAQVVHAYSAANTYTARLTVTDNTGWESSVEQVIQVGPVRPQNNGGFVNACREKRPVDYAQLHNNQAVCVASSSDERRYFYFKVPANAKILRLTTNYGTGNVDMFYNYASWASNTNYHFRSDNINNTESITVGNLREGWSYVSVEGSHADLSLQLNFKYD